MPEQVTIDVDGVSIVLRSWPTAFTPSRPPLVLLHATGETAQDWDVIAQGLQSSRTVVAINLRGHGPSCWPGRYSVGSMARDVTRVLQAHFPHRRVDLVGHSMGGLVACSVAADRPELVRRLVLEDIGLLTPRPADPPSRPSGVLPFDWQVVEQIRPEIDDFDPGWAGRIASIAAPTLVIAGGERSHIPQGQVDELVDCLPQGTLVTLEVGHLVHAGKPKEFTRELLRFLDR